MSDLLAREVAVVAARLASLLEQALPADGALAQAQSFLRAVADSAGSPDDARAKPPRDRPLARSPLHRLGAALGLANVELDLIILAGLTDEHEGFAGILRSVHPRNEPYATVGLAAQLFCRSPAERELFRFTIETGAAIRSGALRVENERPFFERSLYAMERLWSVLNGLDVWPAIMIRLEKPAPVAGLERWLASAACQTAQRALQRGERCTLLVSADSEETACERAGALADAAGVAAVRVAPGPGASLPEFERHVTVHALARGVIPIVRFPPPEDGTQPAPLGFADHPGPVVLCARTGSARPRGGRPVLPIPVQRLSHADRQTLWAAALPELADHAPVLAARYGVEPAGAEAVAADVRTQARLEARAPSLADVATSISTRNTVAVAAGLKLIRPRATWDNLVLSHDRMAQLREALDRLLHQVRVIDEWGFLDGRAGARGVRVLFSGPPGTGKTLSAEVLAHALGVDLMLVDIARVVSKWIGETEKNLAAVFDAAERAQAVLFFDEADALFGKRTEVSDAHDRYANLETAYLLNRLERFEGLAILSTNLRQAIDPAFVRRLEFVVEFDEPNLAERIRLWRCHIPAAAPLAADADLHQLATLYPVVGGLIKNAAVAAGFLAAAEGSAITRIHLIRAIRREYAKAGRAFPGAPFGLDVF